MSTNPKPLISLVVAMSDNRVIGRDNALPWHLPADLKHFKSVTMGKPILMGRRTFESIGRPLPGRQNLVLTRSLNWRHEGVTVVPSFDEALHLTSNSPELCVIGGARVFDLALRLASRIYLTKVHATIEGDTFFPPFDEWEWQILKRSTHAPDARHAYPLTFETLQRVFPTQGQCELGR